MTTRRAFLRTAITAPAVLAFGGASPDFLRRLAANDDPNNDERILVVVQMSGGNDSLNTVVPHSDEVYRELRPTLAISKSEALSINRELGFHPAMTGFANLLEAGQLAIVQGVGYPNPNRSHFESMDIWHTCRRKTETRTAGWLGMCLDAPPWRTMSDAPAIHLGHAKQPFALAAREVRVPSIRSLEQFRLNASGDRSAETIRELAAAPREMSGGLLDFVQSSTTTALDVSDRFNLPGPSVESIESYPSSELGRNLATVSHLISAGLKTRIYYLEIDGFDTHARQVGGHAVLLGQVSDAVGAFMKDMTDRKQQDRVLVMCFSEFGRRVAENASNGTDHGAAASMFFAGGKVTPGLHGEHPSLTDLDQGDLKHHTDFRQVYATVLEKWFGRPSTPILGEEYAVLNGLLA